MRDRKLSTAIAVVGGICALAGCAIAPPPGPSVMALPSQGKSLTAFQQEDVQCRNYANATIGFSQPGQAGSQTVVGSAAVGTALGAAAGAAIGAAAGNAGAGAAIGGATGLLGGTAVGANNAAGGEYDLQQRYNIAYTQCMYSRGNTVQSPPVDYAAYGWAYPYGYGYPWYGYPWYGYPWYGYPWYGYPWYGTGFSANFFVFRGPRHHDAFFGHGFHRGGFHGGHH